MSNFSEKKKDTMLLLDGMLSGFLKTAVFFGMFAFLFVCIYFVTGSYKKPVKQSVAQESYSDNTLADLSDRISSGETLSDEDYSMYADMATAYYASNTDIQNIKVLQKRLVDAKPLNPIESNVYENALANYVKNNTADASLAVLDNKVVQCYSFTDDELTTYETLLTTYIDDVKASVSLQENEDYYVSLASSVGEYFVSISDDFERIKASPENVNKDDVDDMINARNSVNNLLSEYSIR